LAGAVDRRRRLPRGIARRGCVDLHLMPARYAALVRNKGSGQRFETIEHLIVHRYELPHCISPSRCVDASQAEPDGTHMTRFGRIADVMPVRHNSVRFAYYSKHMAPLPMKEQA